MAETLGEIHKVDPSFDKERFIKECQFEIIPTVLEAYLQGRIDILKDWCHEAVRNYLLNQYCELKIPCQMAYQIF